MTMISMISMILLTQVESNGGSFCDGKNTPKPKKHVPFGRVVPRWRVGPSVRDPIPVFSIHKIPAVPQKTRHTKPAKRCKGAQLQDLIKAIFPMAGLFYVFF